jgi:hypothetical protein
MRVLWGLILVSCAWPCVAGHVYRCPDGSFQDKPCGAYRTDLIELKEQQRGGGSASRMDSLNKSKREIEKHIVDTCV